MRPGFEGPVWRIPHPAWEVPPVSPAGVEGSPLIGSFGNVMRGQRIPQLLEAFARLRRERPEARLLLVGAVSPRLRPRSPSAAARLSDEGIVREAYVEEDRLWSLMAACDVVSACARRRWARPRAASSASSRSASRSWSAMSAGSRSSRTTGAEDSRRRARDRDAVRGARAARARTRALADRCRRPRSSSCGVSTTSVAWQISYAAALEQAAGGEVVANQVLGDVSPRCRRRRDRGRLARGGRAEASRRGRAW